MKQLFYKARHRSDEVCKSSSSGGAFTAISDIIFDNNEKASVYGCVMDDSLRAMHKRAVTKSERDLMRGSKYIASNIGNCLEEAAKDLDEGYTVVFSGTPCQIAAVNKFMANQSINTERLITVEVICHGVADTGFFRDYIIYMEKKYGAKAVSCNFRAKSKPGKKQDMRIDFANGKHYSAASTNYDWFYSLYLNNLALRRSCFECKFARPERGADISIADLWEKNPKDLIDRSLIIFNTEKGCSLKDELSAFMTLSEALTDTISLPNLSKAAIKPSGYDEFWRIYKASGFMAAQKYAGNNTLKGRLRSLCITAADKIGLRKLKSIGRGTK